jgi:hypothetical protein
MGTYLSFQLAVKLAIHISDGEVESEAAMVALIYRGDCLRMIVFLESISVAGKCTPMVTRK